MESWEHPIATIIKMERWPSVLRDPNNESSASGADNPLLLGGSGSFRIEYWEMHSILTWDV
jgi:hypothetical protein